MVLLLSVAIAFIVSVEMYFYSEIFTKFISVLIILIPLLYYCNWDYSLIFHKPDADEIKLAVIMFIFYMIYSVVILFILDTLAPTGGEAVVESYLDADIYIALIFSMMFEELFKFIPLMFFMRLFYKHSNNRNVSFIFSAILTLTGFGLLHYGGGLTILSVLVVQGLGSVFDLYGYYKTKNLLVPYLSHLLTDAFVMGLEFIPFLI